MKKLLLLALLGLFTLNGIAQDQPTSNALKLNEVRINALYTLFGLPDFTYERILNEESAIGISVAIAIDNNISHDYIIIPYYRLYFGEKYASGFFFEANSALSSEPSYYGNRLALGLGIACGGKFLTKSGWIGEIVIGAGRNLIKPEHANDAYPRFGITIGKRF